MRLQTYTGVIADIHWPNQAVPRSDDDPDDAPVTLTIDQIAMTLDRSLLPDGATHTALDQHDHVTVIGYWHRQVFVIAALVNMTRKTNLGEPQCRLSCALYMLATIVMFGCSGFFTQTIWSGTAHTALALMLMVIAMVTAGLGAIAAHHALIYATAIIRLRRII